LSFVLLTALSLPLPANAKIENFELDPVHTRVAFQISHAGFSNPIGTFSGTTGTLSFDPDDWSSAQLSVHIPIATLNLGDVDWQEKILDPTFFNAKEFPEASFVSTRVESTGENTAQVTGDLTLHGVTQPVTLTVTLNALKRHPLTFKKTAGFSATATLSRKAFGMTAWSSLVGDDVHLIIEAEAHRSKEPADGAAQ
jgi:polyisoprenoid-binding protein YceI